MTRRAAACMKLGRHADALADAETAVAAEASYAKGYLRRALAHQALGGLDSLEQAVRDFEKVCVGYLPRVIKTWVTRAARWRTRRWVGWTAGAGRARL